jgi:hypothetical protein
MQEFPVSIGISRLKKPLKMSTIERLKKNSAEIETEFRKGSHFSLLFERWHKARSFLARTYSGVIARA